MDPEDVAALEEEVDEVEQPATAEINMIGRGKLVVEEEIAEGHVSLRACKQVFYAML